MTDPALLPPQALVAYEMPDGISRRTIEIDDLPADWILRETHTQTVGDRWLDSKAEVLLFVPSVVVPIANVPDRNVLINRRVADAASINIVHVIPFTVEPRLFSLWDARLPDVQFCPTPPRPRAPAWSRSPPR